MRLLPCGDTAILIELPSADERARWDAHLRTHHIPGVVEHVPGATTVLVRAAAGSLQAVADHLRHVDPAPVAPPTATDAVVIPMRYDGVDLNAVADHLGMAVDALVDTHQQMLWVVAFTGFSPGFAYLSGQATWNIPRQHSPRPDVPAGSVAVAGAYCGIYPRSGPGGWQIIGSTAVTMWDDDRDPPALLAPGATVRFEAL